MHCYNLFLSAKKKIMAFWYSIVFVVFALLSSFSRLDMIIFDVFIPVLS